MTENQKLREALQLIAWSNDSKWQADCARQALALPTADHIPDAGEMVADHLPDAGKMTNGLTQSETDASASVSGLTAAPVVEREAFENEMRHVDVWGHRSLKKRASGNYENWQVNLMWDVWQARAALSAGDAGWQPIETAPKDGTRILAYIHIDDGDIGVMKWMDFGAGLATWVWVDELMGDVDPDPYQPTHWMPLPPPPSAIRARGEGV